MEFGEVDRRGWNWNNDENYTVKSYYDIVVRHLAKKALKDHEILQDFPHIKISMKTIPHKVTFFSWMAYLNCIQVMDKLLQEGVEVNDVFCHRVGETSNHLVVQCPIIKSLGSSFLSSQCGMGPTGGC